MCRAASAHDRLGPLRGLHVAERDMAAIPLPILSTGPLRVAVHVSAKDGRGPDRRVGAEDAHVERLQHGYVGTENAALGFDNIPDESMCLEVESDVIFIGRYEHIS